MTQSEQRNTPSRWDEAWACPCGLMSIGMGDGKRGDGNCVITFSAPPRCGCGREMEQVTGIGIDPEDCRS